MGKHAFFPGHLTHTNELLLHLGDQYYAEVTAAAAQGILQRKLAVISEGVQKAQQQLQTLQSKLTVVDSSSSSSDSFTANDVIGEGVVDIRTTEEESDEVLSWTPAAKKSKMTAAALRQLQQQQPSSKIQIRSPAGYQYKPLGLLADQPVETEPFLEAKAKLDELLKLEEQQQVEGQQQQQQRSGLETITEGDEELGEEQIGTANQAQGSSPLSSAAASASTAQRLQQAEAATDSDDDEEHPGQQQQQQQSTFLSGGSVVERRPAAGLALQQQQQPQPARAVTFAADDKSKTDSGSYKIRQNKPLKSALKKGFLSSPATKHKAASSAVAAFAAADQGKVPQQKPDIISSPAFTGTVVERSSATVPEQAEVLGTASAPSTAAGVSAVGPVVEKSVAENVVSAAVSQPVSNSNVGNRPSRFKLRRMGLDPSAE